MSVRGLLYLVIPGALAGLGGWLLLTADLSPSPRETPARETPDLVMEQVEATLMNDRGLREYTLTARQLRRLPGSGGTELEQPVLELFQDGRALLWRVRAERGWISPDQEQIRMEDNVVLNRTAAGGVPLTVTTSRLMATPRESLAHTDAPVRLETPAGVADAIGARAYLDQQRLELLSQVRGHYDPPIR